MEIGAQDGEFMSLTLYLEQEMGFRGLLVEPNPRDYAALRATRRASASINACATPRMGHRKVHPRTHTCCPRDLVHCLVLFTRPVSDFVGWKHSSLYIYRYILGK